MQTLIQSNRIKGGRFIEPVCPSFEEVNSAKYLGTIMNADNLIEEEIRERIAAGNRFFFANKKIFQSKLITRKTKERLYHTVIRPVAVYGSE